MSKAITINILFFLLLSISIPTQSSISLTISQSGLDFLKNVLVNQALSSLTPLQILPIQQTLKIPLLGRVHVILSNITIYRVDVPTSLIKPGDSGITIVASAASCNLSLHWHYSYSSWLLPLQISDSGSASVQVEGMEIGLTLGLETRFGYLNISLLESGCYVRDIFIQLNGGASWLYQGMVDAFEDQIESAVEHAIVNKLEDGVLKLKSSLQDLPREISIDDIASLNVTFVDDPFLSNNSIGFEIDGLFIKTETAPVLNKIHKHSQSLDSCTHLSKMLGVSLDEAVFKSASALYFNAEFMQWTVDKVPDQSLLNTAWWRFIVPQLYKKYPKDDMDLNITLSAPPAVQILPRGIGATVYADLIIDVLEDGNVVPVICISLVIRGSGSVKTVGNNLSGSLKLDDFSMSLKWSKIGKLHMNLIQPVMWTIIETVFLPYANSRLGKGFPLPIIHGFTLQDTEIIFSNAALTICSDVNFTEQYDLRKSPTYPSKWTPKLM